MTLVIGYGNDLRGDDAVGPRAAELAAARFPDRVRSLACHQLTPELAEPIAAAPRVIFIDAAIHLPADGPPVVSRVVPHPAAGPLGHALDPAHLLALAQSLYATVPEAWLIAVPAVSFDLGQPLSAVAQAGLEQALGHVEHLCHP